MGEPLGEEQMLLSPAYYSLREHRAAATSFGGGERKARGNERGERATNQARPCSLGQMLGVTAAPHRLKARLLKGRCLTRSLSGCYFSAVKVKATLHGLFFSDE